MSVALSLNVRAGAVADAMVADAAALGIGAARGPSGEAVVDCGHHHRGGTEAGLRLARACLAGLAEVTLVPTSGAAATALPWTVAVRTARPVLACLASQYAGWPLEGHGGPPLLGSGPARALARREALFDEIGHEERADRAVLVLEGDAPPPPEVGALVAEACGVAPERLTMLHTPTGSLAGMAQIAARALECAMQKARSLGSDLSAIVDAVAAAPLCPPHPEQRVAMGRANDAIIYGGRALLSVTGPAEAARTLAEALPSRTSPEWGRGFAEVYAEAGGDFARIDAGFFSPAEVVVVALETGEAFFAGEASEDRLRGIVRSRGA